MNYKELKNVAEARKIMIKDLAERLGMTPNGFKVSIETEKFPIGKVRDLCSVLQITIMEFFGDTPSNGVTVASEVIPYSMPMVKRDFTAEANTVEMLAKHIAWLENEVDRLRQESAKHKK